MKDLDLRLKSLISLYLSWNAEDAAPSKQIEITGVFDLSWLRGAATNVPAHLLCTGFRRKQVSWEASVFPIMN